MTSDTEDINQRENLHHLNSYGYFRWIKGNFVIKKGYNWPWEAQGSYHGREKYYLALGKCKHEENLAKCKEIKTKTNTSVCKAKIKSIKKCSTN